MLMLRLALSRARVGIARMFVRNGAKAQRFGCCMMVRELARWRRPTLLARLQARARMRGKPATWVQNRPKLPRWRHAGPNATCVAAPCPPAGSRRTRRFLRWCGRRLTNLVWGVAGGALFYFVLKPAYLALFTRGTP